MGFLSSNVTVPFNMKAGTPLPPAYLCIDSLWQIAVIAVMAS